MKNKKFRNRILLIGGISLIVLFPIALIKWIQNSLDEDYGPIYSLTSDGDHLYVSQSETGKIFDVVSGVSAPVKVEVDWVNSRISILDDKDDKTVPSRKAEFIQSSFWSEYDQAVYFLARDSSDREYPDSVWRWTRNDGFQEKYSDKGLESLSESLDGKFLCATATTIEKSKTDSNDWVHHDALVVIDKVNFRTRQIESSHHLNKVQMVSNDCFLNDTNPCEIWKPSTNSFKPIGGQSALIERVIFHGDIWAIRYLNSHYQVVKLSKDLESFGKVIELPKNFPEAGPPGWIQY